MTARDFYNKEEKYNVFSKLTNTGISDDLEKVIEFAEDYHKAKLKLLGIANVVGQGEQLCKHKRVIKSRLRMEDGKSRYCKDCQEWLT